MLQGFQMTYLQAAIRVLRATRRPMTTRDITEAAVRNGYIRPHGKTPEATMSSALYRHVNGSAAVIRRDHRPGPTRAVRDSVRWQSLG